MQKFIEEQCGISLGEEKAYLIESRLTKLLIDSGLHSFEELYRAICSKNDSGMAEKVIDAITTNETLWFRDKTPWEVLENELLPEFIKEIRSGTRTRVRIWSAACSTGQEPYSTAICIDNFLKKHGIKDVTPSYFEVIATDISRTVLDVAKAGRYDSISIMRGLDVDIREKYFKNEGRVWILDEKIKNMVHFQQFNLQNRFFSMGQFDIVFLRYVTIYFSEKLRAEVLDKTASILKPQGALFIGSSELLNQFNENFIVQHYKNGIYYRVKR